MKRILFFCCVFFSPTFTAHAQDRQLIPDLVSGQNQSSLLQVDDDNRLVYHSDERGNRIPDFSHAGYRNGEAEIPDIPVVLEVEPIPGDNTAHIQAAIDEVSGRPLDENGFRGAILLKTGRYPVHGTLYIRHSGVVLRGSGEISKSKNFTTLQGRYNTPEQRTLIVIGSNGKSSWNNAVAGSRVAITSEYVPAGSRTFEVADASKFSVGDNVVIRHPSTEKWLAAVNFGDTAKDGPWVPGDLDMVFNRFITQIEGNKIKVATPLYHELDRALSQAYVWITTRENLVTNVGIEKLRVDIQTSGPEDKDEDHIWNGVAFNGVEDCWAKNVAVLHFGHAGITLRNASRCTILNSSATDPVSIITGGRRYNFEVASYSNNILFENCHATKGRHAFVSNGASKVAGIVFKKCHSSEDFTASESHRRWGQALLYDQTSHHSTTTNRVLGLYNRGDYGTGHGWTGTHQVAWNVSAPNNQIVIQKPPIGQNYCIGCIATVDNQGPFIHPAGWIESTGRHVFPASLYEAQLSERLTYGVGPDAPAKLKAAVSTTAHTQQVALAWLDIALDEDHYVVERSTDGGNSFEVVAELAKNVQSFTDTNLLKDSYHYRVKAVNAVGSSAYSNIVQVHSLALAKTMANLNAAKAAGGPFSDETGPYDMMLFLFAGQSNMGGRGTIEAQDLETHPRVFMLTDDGYWVPAQDPVHFDKPKIRGVGPALSFGKTVAAAYPDRVIGLIPTAVGGTGIDFWRNGAFHQRTNTHPYDDAVSRAKRALASGGTIEAVLWHQGESDSSKEKAVLHAAKLIRMSHDLRCDIGAPGALFLVGGFAEYYLAKRQNAHILQRTFENISGLLPNSAFVSAFGLEHIGDVTHLTAASAREFGRRYAAVFQKEVSQTREPRSPLSCDGSLN